MAVGDPPQGAMHLGKNWGWANNKRVPGAAGAAWVCKNLTSAGEKERGSPKFLISHGVASHGVLPTELYGEKWIRK